jgi:hypothetical protein
VPQSLKLQVWKLFAEVKFVVDVIRQIEDYLDLLGMKYSWDDKEGIFELLFSERKDSKTYTPSLEDDGLSFKYTIYIRPGERWVQVYTDIISLDNIPKEKRDDVFLDLLRANRRYAEVCFDYDETKRIVGTSQEMMAQGLNFDAFREEFLAVPWAVKRFWTEIAKKHELE